MMVLQDVLQIYESEGMKLKGGDGCVVKINLDKNCDIYESVSRHSPKGSSGDNCFTVASGGEQHVFVCESKISLFDWTSGLKYVQQYWLKRIAADEAKKKLDPKSDNVNVQVPDLRLESSNTKMFVLPVMLNDSKVATLSLTEFAKYHELFMEINKSSTCPNCPTCRMREISGKLYVVDKSGKAAQLERGDLLHKHFKAGCTFYFLEHHHKVIVVFFRDRSFVGIPVDPVITASQILQLPVLKNKCSMLGVDEPGLFYRTAAGDSLFSDDELPVTLFYESKSGIWKEKADVEGSLILQDRSLPVTSDLEEIDARTQVYQAKIRDHIKQRDETTEEISSMLSQRRNLPANGRTQSNDEVRPAQPVHVASSDLAESTVISGLIFNTVDSAAHAALNRSAGQLSPSLSREKPPKVDSASESLTVLPVEKRFRNDDFGTKSQQKLLSSPTHVRKARQKLSNSRRAGMANIDEIVAHSGIKREDLPAVELPKAEVVDGRKDPFPPPEMSAEVSDRPCGSIDKSPLPELEVCNHDQTVEPARVSSTSMLPETGTMYGEEIGPSNTALSATTYPHDPRTEVRTRSDVASESDLPIKDACVRSDVLNVNTDFASSNVICADVSASPVHIAVEPVVVKSESTVATTEATKASAVERKVPGQKLTCSLCEQLEGKRPFSVTTYNLMTHQVLVCASKPNEEIMSKENEKDYICLFDIHLRNTRGRWVPVDGTQLKTMSEDLWDDNVEEDQTKSNKVIVARKKNQSKVVTLNGGIVCKWTTYGHGVRGKWRAFALSEAVTQEPANLPSKIEPCPVQMIPASVTGNTVVQVQSGELTLSSDDDEGGFDNDNFPGLPARGQFPSSELGGDLAKLKLEAGKVISKAKSLLNEALDKTLAHQPMVLSRYPSDAVIPDELIFVRERYMQPLKQVVAKVVALFESCQSRDEQSIMGDDYITSSTGWLVRSDLCTAVATLLSIGMKTKPSRIPFFFGKSESYSLWETVQEFCLAYPDEVALGDIVRGIQSSKYLSDENMRFRFFVCEMLNRSCVSGSDKLVVTWFQRFPFCKNQLEKFYHEASFWRIGYTVAFELLMEELVLILAQLNGWPFALHDDFEFDFVRTVQANKTRELSWAMHERSKQAQGPVIMLE